jgi:predicted Rossmann fold flavoprotein
MRIAIIGGGAAGFFAAIRAKELRPDAYVAIYEKGSRPLAKVAVTGGGRCNLINSFNEVRDLKQVYPRGAQLMKRLFNTFNYKDTYEWFESRGVKLVTQDDECVFPHSQSSQSIIDCLINNARRLGVDILPHHALGQIIAQEDTLHLVFNNGQKETDADRVVITTGGHPQGNAFDYLKQLGHEIISPIPSLFTFNIPDKSIHELMGTVVENAITTIVGTKMRSEGPLLITHWGMSGPAILRLSSYGARWMAEKNYRFQISVDWVGERNASIVSERLHEAATGNSGKQIGNVRPFALPSRLWFFLLKRAEITSERRWGEIGRKNLNKLVETLTNDIYLVEGKSSWREEFVTCGGISLSSIQPNTLESKHVKGLYFAGEVCDVDAVTGGFNLQAAWTMGYVAGTHAVSD